MPELSEQLLEGLRGELKLAFSFSPRISSALGALGAGGGVGAAGGALIGAAVQGGRKFREERAQGASIAEALGGSLAHGMAGAGRGALIGGAIGAGVGGATGAINPAAGEKFRNALKNLPGANFGQRQVHTFTGWKPKGGLAEIGHGASSRLGAVRRAEQELFAARNAGKPISEAVSLSEEARKFLPSGKTLGGDVRYPKARRSLVDRVMGRSAVEAAQKRVENARAAYEAGRKAEEMGLTSIPGYVKALRDRPVGEVLRTAVNDQWKGMSPAMKALMIGLPAAELASAVWSKDEPDAQGDSKGERIGRSLAQTAGGFLLSPLTMTGQMVAGTALSRAGGAIGRAAGRGKGKLLPPPPPGPADLTADSGQAVAGERYISDRAAGQLGAGEGFSA